MSRALKGVRVVELCEIVQGPLAGQILGDLGADVVKVERWPRGDGMRVLDRQAVENSRVSSYFVALNRNKRSIVLDLKSDGGIEILHRLLADADVLVHNYRSHAIRRLGLSYADLAERYPQLVYASASGFGATGPLARKPGQDMLAQTISGLARAVGNPELASYLSPTPAVDYASGMGLAQGILAALLERERSGRGQEVSVNLLDTAVALQLVEVAAHTMYAAELNWVTQWYTGTFRTTDGVVTVVGLFRDNAVRLICQALDVPDLSLRPELATTGLQARNKQIANEVLAPVVAELSTEEALDRFDKADLLCAPQLTLAEALEHPQLAANGLLVDVDVAGQDAARVVGYPVRLSRSPGQVRREVPRLGQHTREVLADLGYSPGQIAELASRDAIHTEAAQPPAGSHSEAGTGTARARMLARLNQTIDAGLPGLPHYADPRTGEWTTSPDGDWTGGHFVGQLWLAARHDPRCREAAGEYSARLDRRADSPTIFRGFLFHYGAALGGHLLGDATAWKRAERGARGLLSSFNPAAGIMPLGTAAEEAHSVGDTETSIDAVGTTSALLSAVAERTGDDTMREAAVAHARRHIEICVRADGSVCQSGSIDPETGEIVRRYSHKGHSPSSTWARAQAWAMLAFTMSARWLPGHPEFLDAAVTVTDWWAAHVPEDRVAFWDFDDPEIPDTLKDTSSTAIAAASLLKLAALLPDGRRYRDLAARTVDALVTGYLRAVPGLPAQVGVLGSGCYNKLIGLATANELVWGDYYLTEALAVLDGDLDALAV